MANRRTPDSQKPSRSAPPPVALVDSGAAAAGTPKKPRKRMTEPTPAINAAVDSALGATAPSQAAPGAKPRKRRTAAEKAQAVIAATAAPEVSEDERRGMIALSAYLRGERRGFAHGGEAEDWALAEKEVDALLSKSTTSRQ